VAALQKKVEQLEAAPAQAEEAAIKENKFWSTQPVPQWSASALPLASRSLPDFPLLISGFRDACWRR